MKANNSAIQSLLLCLVVGVAYLPTFSGQFILDDKPLIEKNAYIRNVHSLGSYLAQEDGVSEESPAEYHTSYYRPLVNLSYWLDVQVWGLNASGFRITNVILHLLTCFTLMGFLTGITQHRSAAFLAAFLFALHPVATESVSWITSRNNILATLFGLWSLHFYIRGWEEAQNYRCLLLSITGFVGAIFCKEFGLMLMPIFFLFHRTLSKRKNPAEEVLGYIPFAVILVIYVIFRKNATGSMLTPEATESIWQHILFAPYLILYNLRLILLPYNLHSFIIDYPETYSSWQALAGYSLLIAMAFFVWHVRHEKIVVFGILSFLMGLFPVLNLVPMKSVTLVSMRWLYFTTAFLTVAAAVCIRMFLFFNRAIAVCCVTALALYFGGYSYVLNARLWHDEDTFFQQEVTGFNNLFYARGYALRLLHEGRFDEAERYFLEALVYDPGKAKTYVDYAGLLIDRAEPAKALAYLNTARQLPMGRKEEARWHNEAGMAYFALGQHNEASKHFESALEYGRNTPEFWANLGGTYGARGDYRASLQVLEEGAAMFPESLDIKRNLAITCFLMGKPEKAFEALEGLPRHEVEADKTLQKLIRRCGQKPLLKE